MDKFNSDEVKQLPTIPAFLCPFLAMWDDAETYSANINFKNYCHKAMPVAPVSIDQQVDVCCSQNYRNCIVYKAPQPRSLPPEWIYSEAGTSVPGENRWRVWGGIIIASLLLVVFIYFYWFSGLFHQTNHKIAAIADPYPSTTMGQETGIMATITATSTPLPTSTHRPTIELTSSQTPVFSPTPITSLTPILSLSSPTPGPELETPFGTQPLYLVHRVKEGESLSTIAANFKTTYAVIEVLNNITSDDTIREGTVLVVMPGQTTQVGVPLVKAIYITAAIRVEDFAANYGADVAEVRSFNGLGPDDWIQPNRWVVVRGK